MNLELMTCSSGDNRFYAGIGSRITPQRVISQMELLAAFAANNSWVLRSGAADGADSAFERGCDSVNGEKQIFLPWPAFRQHPSSYNRPSSEAGRLAVRIHPIHAKLSYGAKMLIARNMHQILGPNLDEPVSCVICWTPDGCENAKQYGKTTGGTGSAISLASEYGVPVFNLFNRGRFEDAQTFLGDIT